MHRRKRHGALGATGPPALGLAAPCSGLTIDVSAPPVPYQAASQVGASQTFNAITPRNHAQSVTQWLNSLAFLQLR